MLQALSGMKAYGIAAGAALVIASLAYAYHAATVSGLKGELADEVKAHATCQGNVTTLKAQLQRQNDAAAALGEDGAAGEASADAAASRALADSERARRRAASGGTSPAEMNAFMQELFG